MTFTIIKHKKHDVVSEINITCLSDMQNFKDMYPDHEVVFNANEKIIDIYGYETKEENK